MGVDAEQIAALMKAPGWTIEPVSLDDDAEVRSLSDDVAMIAYGVHEELIVEGEPMTLDAADSSVWVRRDGRWLCALHTDSIRAIHSAATGAQADDAEWAIADVRRFMTGGEPASLRC